ncbi:MAG: hypothetical protein COV67_15165 [Nitrospinae bacterium CG11_big_fil_rev_8_21_14_0_20_56_8]|nr:MAG: hypothetical protein COV67_15165 [Nitrospinae bacterium CG11_big_fil_rev_8_21_14_0_20_56_8]
MENLKISKGWFDKENSSKVSDKKKVFCEHKADTITIDYVAGVEYCQYCGALGHYNVDSDSLDWTLPKYLLKQNYN